MFVVCVCVCGLCLYVCVCSVLCVDYCHLDRLQHAYILLHHIELVFLANQTPNDSDILDDDIDGYRANGAQHARQKLEQTEAVQREGLDDTEHIHIDINGRNEGAYKVNQIGAGDRIEAGEYNV